MKPLLRHLLLATLMASAALALWPDASEPGLVPVTATAADARTAAMPAAAVMPVLTASATPAASVTAGQGLPARSADWPEPSAQALRAWQSNAGPAAVDVAAAAVRASAPAAPTAPALPYQWLGVLDDGQGPQALLAGRSRSVALRVGQTLDRDWRLDSLAAGQLLLTWLPGNQRLSLSLNTNASPRAAQPTQNPAPEPK